MAKCYQFLVAKKLIDGGSEPFFSSTPCADAPLLITAWIMDGYAKLEHSESRHLLTFLG